ncbi:MAG: hypothetical protein KGS61_16400 [Verrucomicrobia bacterium]|nr:hypothetical protein [Verrucomicrobiota bacterium]
MSARIETTAPAWQPFTTGGVAAFARARWGRLLAVEFLVAALAAVSVVWFVATAWVPVIARAIERLPDQGAVRQGRLDWPQASPVALAGNPFLSIVVDVQGGNRLGQTADVQWTFSGRGLRGCSLFGCLRVPYPAFGRIPFNRLELDPWWGAWRPVLLALLSVGTVLALVLTWTVLGLVYAVPVRGMAFLLDRQVARGGCWRLAVAGQMPGAILLTVAILLYGLQHLNAAGLVLLFALHLVPGWLYALLATLRLPRLAPTNASPTNPFARPGGESGPSADPGREV